MRILFFAEAVTLAHVARPLALAGMAEDVTDKRIRDEQDQWTATHDTLTELPNRGFFQEQLDDRRTVLDQ